MPGDISVVNDCSGNILEISWTRPFTLTGIKITKYIVCVDKTCIQQMVMIFLRGFQFQTWKHLLLIRMKFARKQKIAAEQATVPVRLFLSVKVLKLYLSNYMHYT